MKMFFIWQLGNKKVEQFNFVASISVTISKVINHNQLLLGLETELYKLVVLLYISSLYYFTRPEKDHRFGVNCGFRIVRFWRILCTVIWKKTLYFYFSRGPVLKVQNQLV